MKIQVKLEKVVLVKIGVLYLQKSSNMCVMGDGVSVLMLGPTANGSGHGGQAGQTVRVVHPHVGVLDLSDGLDLEIHLEH